MKNEEEKNRLSVELCYNHQFHRSDSSILDHLRYEKFFQKYSFNRKISNKAYRWLTLKGSKKTTKTAFWQSTNNKRRSISFDWINIYQNNFHNDDDHIHVKISLQTSYLDQTVN